MATSKFHALLTSLLVFLIITTIFFFTSKAASFNYTAHYCSNATIFPFNTTFRRNLNVLLSSLTSNASQYGGYSTTIVGFGTTDPLNGLFLCCGGIVSPAACKDCVAAAAKGITLRCPNRTEAIIWYDECMLGYTGGKYFQYDSVNPGENLHDGGSSDLQQFNISLFKLLNDLTTKAAKSPSVKKFAVGQVILSSSPPPAHTTVYGLEQCPYELTSDQCETCLQKAIGILANCCEGKQGARVLLASCNIRYELYPFYNVTAVSPIRLSPPSGNEKTETRTSVLIVVPVSVAVMRLGGFFLLKRWKKDKIAVINERNHGEEIAPLESLQFSFATIEAATNNFSQLNKIGEGGFGEVYKGVLPDKREIAVKKLSSKFKQGVMEFKNEISLIAKAST